ncbi:MAG: hypothetical protein EU535_08240, partial [Promethearchaeota archaeon]
MAEIYYPIDKSNLKEIIPLGQDIIYSTLCQGFVHDTNNDKKYKWKTHVLMTKEGVAFSIPVSVNYTAKAIKTEPILIQNHFVGWQNIYVTEVQEFIGTTAGFIVPWLYERIRFRTVFKLLRDSEFESKESFKNRSKPFIETFRPLASEKRTKLGEELYDLLVLKDSFPKVRDF